VLLHVCFINYSCFLLFKDGRTVSVPEPELFHTRARFRYDEPHNGT